VSNPFRRKRKDPVEQALDAIEEIRAEAARRAAGLRDAAADAVELLGEAAPEARRYRVPVAAAVVAAGLGTAIALRSRRSRVPEPEQPREPQARTDESEAAGGAE
jgi:hypothetical protein